VKFFKAGLNCDIWHESWSEKLESLGAVGENCVILLSLVLTHYENLTDRQTDMPPIAKSHHRLHSIAERDENVAFSRVSSMN